MLGKLLKYDMKAQGKVHIALYGFATLLAMILMILTKLTESFPKNSVFGSLKPFALIAFVLSIIVMFVATWINGLLKYRSNILKDEGYLMHTLPVPSMNLHFSKLITSCAYQIIDGVVTYVLVSIALLDVNWIKNIFGDAFEALGQGNETKIVIYVIIYMFVAIISGFSQLFFALNFGYTRYSSKDIMSFVGYIITYFVGQFCSMILLVIVSFKNYGGFDIDAMNQEGQLGMVWDTLIGSVVILILLSVVYNVISVYCLNKKLNLE